jgi:outer membrane receptor protein involved in Fe transport
MTPAYPRKIALSHRSLGALLPAAALMISFWTAPAGADGQQPVGADRMRSGKVIEAAEQKTVWQFDIGPKSLNAALLEVASITGIEVLYESNRIAGTRSPGARGRMTALQALQAVLAGTEFTAVQESAGTVRLLSAAGAYKLPPIVVAGEKVARRYKDTMTSVGVTTGDDIETYKLDNLPDAYNTMANVRYFQSNEGNNGMQIRGVNADGISEPENSAPQISVVIDGVAQSSEGLRRGSRGTWDVKQAEVLRGPQSTLQGRNALAGAIVVKTNDPTYDFEAEIKGLTGNHERNDGAFMVSGPVIEDQIALRLAGEFHDETVTMDFRDPEDSPLADDEYRTLRGKLLIEPKALDGLKILLTANDIYDQVAGRLVHAPNFYDRIHNSTLSTTYSTAEIRRMKANNYSADVSYALSEALSLHWVSALHYTNLGIETAPGNTLYTRGDRRKNQDFTQDLRVEFEHDGLTGTVGLFYGHFERASDSEYFLASSIVSGFGDHTIESEYRDRSITSAVYADMRYRFDANWSVLGALRLQRDKVRNYANKDVVGAAQNNVTDILYDKNMDNTVTSNVALPKIGVTYDLSPDRTIGATVARGYRQGFSQIVDSTNSTVKEIDPEYVWTTEIAYRDESLKNLSFGVNVFYNLYKDQQILVTENSQLFATNAGQSYSYGAEVEGRLRLGNGWQAYGALGLLQTEIKDLSSSLCSRTNSICDGNEFPEAPELTFSLGATYNHESGLFASADANVTSSYFSNGSIDNKPQELIGGRYLANVRVGYRFENFKATAFIDNLFDRNYITSASSNQRTASVGDGRTYGIELRAKF